MKDYNDEIKYLVDLRCRHANIECEGGYGNNPAVTMLTRVSVIREGFIKEVDVNYIGKNENGEKEYDNYLIIDSEFGHEIKLPYKKILGMTILSSREQAKLENYLLNKELWENHIDDMSKVINDIINSGNPKGYDVELMKMLLESHKTSLRIGEELIEKGVKPYK